MAIQLIEYPKTTSNLPLRVARGHFATSHSHINYYIDLTMTKHRLSEARQAAIEAVRYYNGIPEGICAIFACVDTCEGFPINSIFNTRNVLDDYQSTSSHDCPLCKAGIRLDAMVNAHGISSF